MIVLQVVLDELPGVKALVPVSSPCKPSVLETIRQMHGQFVLILTLDAEAFGSRRHLVRPDCFADLNMGMN